MLQNPIIQTLILFLGSYTFMTMVKKYGPIGKIVTIAAGIFCVVIWMLRYNRAQIADLYKNPLLKNIIDLVCQITKEPSPGGLAPVTASAARSAAPAAAVAPAHTSAPADAAGGGGAARPRQPVSAKAGGSAPAANAPAGENPRLLVRTDVEYRTLAYRLKEQFAACDDTIEGTLRQIQGSVRMRERSQPTAAMPPLGMNLYMGKQGLGKRSLAIEIGAALYGGDAVGVLDLADRGANLASVVAAARGNGYQVFIIENADTAPHQVQTDLLTAFTGAPLFDGASGTPVSFRNCFFFLLVHKQADSFPKPVASSAGTGFTVVVNHLAGATELDQMLALALHGVYPFRLPEPAEQAAVIARLMEVECNKYNLSLGRVDPRVLAREVEDVGKMGNFRAATARISRILSGPISTALARQSASVNVEAAAEERA